MEKGALGRDEQGADERGGESSLCASAVRPSSVETSRPFSFLSFRLSFLSPNKLIFRLPQTPGSFPLTPPLW